MRNPTLAHIVVIIIRFAQRVLHLQGICLWVKGFGVGFRLTYFGHNINRITLHLSS